MMEPGETVAHDDGDPEQYAGDPVDDGWDESDEGERIDPVAAPDEAN